MVLKTSTRQTVFLPVAGLVDPATLKPGDLVGVNKDSYLILDTLPAEYDSRVKAMEVDEKPTEDYSDIGGLDKQIQELREAIVLPITHKDRFAKLGIRPPKGVLLHGPPGEGARAGGGGGKRNVGVGREGAAAGSEASAPLLTGSPAPPLPPRQARARR